MTTLSLIAAVDHHRAIGKGNALPWHLPADLKRFKALTLGKPVLMGRKTAESIGRPLPGRRNLVLTRSGQAPFDGMESVASIDEALAMATESGELCVIGGGEVYALCLARRGARGASGGREARVRLRVRGLRPDLARVLAGSRRMRARLLLLLLFLLLLRPRRMRRAR